MKWLYVTIILLGIGASLALGAGGRDITSREAKNMLEKNSKIFLLDVRTPEERQQGYIAGSVLIPINVVEQRISEVPRNRPVVVYCAVGSRSGVAAQILARKGYGEVYNMKDGILGWYRNGFAIQR